MEVKSKDGELESSSSLASRVTELPANLQAFIHGSSSIILNPPPQNHPDPVQSPPPSYSPVRYRECLKNHAAKNGGHVLDGCGEFMPTGEDGTPESFKCAACECHRNFHRREGESETDPPNSLTYYYNINYPRRMITEAVAPSSAPPGPGSHFNYQYSNPRPSQAVAPMMMMAFGGGGSGGVAAESSSEDFEIHRHVACQEKKRFRTKFSEEQKMKMMEFANKIGWRIQKHDEEQVLKFCSDVGVKRQVFKVWMHNNKQSTKNNS